MVKPTKAQQAALQAIARGQVIRRLPLSVKPPSYAPPAGIRRDWARRFAVAPARRLEVAPLRVGLCV